jgi:hypothetical protein
MDVTKLHFRITSQKGWKVGKSLARLSLASAGTCVERLCEERLDSSEHFSSLQIYQQLVLLYDLLSNCAKFEFPCASQIINGR